MHANDAFTQERQIVSATARTAGADPPPGLHMYLPARAENVAVVRSALAGFAESLGMDEVGIDALKTVATEACMNVVVHAYPVDEPGPLEVEAHPAQDGLTVVVRDFGSGIDPRPNPERPSLRLGLTLIAALSSSFEIRAGSERGTEVRMQVSLQAPERGARSGRAVPAPVEATVIRIVPPELIAPVLGRAVSALVGRRESAELRVGPLASGDAERLREGLELPGVDASLETLADELRVEHGEEGEFLVVAIAALTT
jgi:serine/threonine-protein kinase RsbW